MTIWPQRISIVGPTYNESGNISLFVQDVDAALAGYNWEILFVDDNSSDGTAATVFELASIDDRVRLILRMSDRGLAKSCIQGMLSAKGELLCVMDVDGQHDPEVIVDMVARMEADGLDIISAARQLDDIGASDALSPVRNKISKLGNKLCEILLKRKLSDPLTGYFIIRRDAFLRVAPQLGDAGFKILLDILYSDKSLKHAEIPFEFGSRRQGESKFDSFVAWTFLSFLLSKISGGLLPPKLVSFLLVGALGLPVHFATLYVFLGLGLNFVWAQSMAAFAAATSNFFLNDLLTFHNQRLSGRKMFWGYLKFIAVSSVGIVANVSVASIANDRLIHVVFLATIAGIAMDTLWKFVMINRFIWK
jgi:dolichol-phosphate mannosyltransferase